MGRVVVGSTVRTLGTAERFRPHPGFLVDHSILWPTEWGDVSIIPSLDAGRQPVGSRDPQIGEERLVVGLAAQEVRHAGAFPEGEVGLDFYGATQRWSQSTADIRPAALASEKGFE